MNVESELALQRLRGNPTEIERMLDGFEALVRRGKDQGLIEEKCPLVRRARRLMMLTADVLRDAVAG